MKKWIAIVCLLLAIPLFGQTIDLSKYPGAKIMIPIIEQTAQGDYHDSLYYTPAEFAKLTPADITAAKASRVANWIAFVKAQSSKPAVKPVKADLEARKAELLKQIDELDLQLGIVKVIKDPNGTSPMIPLPGAVIK